MFVEEQVNTGDTSQTEASRDTTRIFKVWPATQEVACTAIGTSPTTGLVVAIPALGDKLPWDSNQEAVAIVGAYIDDSVQTVMVSVRYSTSGATWGGINPANPNFKSWSMSYSRVIQNIPYAIRDPRQFRYQQGNGTVKIVTSYPVRQNYHPEYRKKYIRRLRILAYNASTMDAIISQQANSLHRIYQRWYLFTTGDIVEAARNTWDVSYVWEYDTGTDDVFVDTADVAWPHFPAPIWMQMPNGTFYARPPFHEVGTRPIYNTTTNTPFWPVFEPVCAYDYDDPSGYLTLPGFSL